MQRIVTCLLMIGLIVGPVAGTTLIKKNLSQLAREADAIVVAKVAANSCAWNDKKTLIWTRTQVRVLETWKGKVSRDLDVMEPGGVVHPVGQKVPGMARYKTGDTVVIFLKKDVLGQWRTHGCIQGVFPVARRKDGTLAPRIGKWTSHVVKGYVAKDVSMSAFETRVKQLVAAGRGK